MAESLPTSLSAFAHRRARADSSASFTYYQGEPEAPEGERPSQDDLYSSFEGDTGDEEDAELEREADENDYALHRRSSTQSRASVRSRLLRRDSTTTDGGAFGAGRASQKIYMANEDLYIVLAGFRTSTV